MLTVKDTAKKRGWEERSSLEHAYVNRLFNGVIRLLEASLLSVQCVPSLCPHPIFSPFPTLSHNLQTFSSKPFSSKTPLPPPRYTVYEFVVAVGLIAGNVTAGVLLQNGATYRTSAYVTKKLTLTYTNYTLLCIGPLERRGAPGTQHFDFSSYS